MSTTWFTSDIHWGHKKIVEYSHRPFANIEEHDKYFASMWSKTVKHDDIVWILGDLSIESSWSYALSILASLPGRKRLVTGNHDQAWTGKPDFMKYMAEYLKVFEFVSPWARTKINGTKVNLSHFPYVGDHTSESRFDMYRLPISDRPIIHGHTHSSGDPVSKVKFGFQTFGGPPPVQVPQIHVGVDAHDYKFLTMQQVSDLLES